MRNLVILFFIFLISFQLAESQSDDFVRKLVPLDRYFKSSMKEWNVPGMAIAIIKDDQTIFQKGYGLCKIGQTDTVNEHTVFAIASNTKAFTSSALAVMVHSKEINWDDKVISYLPDFKMYDKNVTKEITVRDLLCHRSGLKTFSGDLIWYGSDFSREKVVHNIRYLKPLYDFRDTYGYSNVMYLVAGLVIEEVSDQTWDEYIKHTFFDPLGMDNTITTFKQVKEQTNIAFPHNEIGGEMIAIEHMNWDNIGPAGSIQSSITDMAKWIKFQLNTSNLKRSQLFDDKINTELRQIHIIQTMNKIEKESWPEMQEKGYGLGWKIYEMKDHEIIFHGGAIDGMISLVAMIPNEKFGLVILTNSSKQLPLPLMYHIIKEYYNDEHINYVNYFNRYYKQVDEAEKEFYKVLESKQDKSIKPTIPLVEFTGVYSCDVYGDALVELKGGTLYVTFANSFIFKGETEHYKGNKFWIKMTRVPSLPKGIVEFVADDNYIRMNIEIPNPDFDFLELDFKKKLNK